jgi:hypothetical protein
MVTGTEGSRDSPRSSHSLRPRRATKSVANSHDRRVRDMGPGIMAEIGPVSDHARRRRPALWMSRLTTAYHRDIIVAPARAASIVAMSIFFIDIMASIARLAAAVSCR